MDNYPSPCISCQHDENGACREYDKCPRWRTRYLYRQKQINGIMRSLCMPQIVKAEVFQYEHPDIVRRFYVEGPCESCGVKETCDFPCQARLLWWNIRMEQLRKNMAEQKGKENE